jgi:hypothetical protein
MHESRRPPWQETRTLYYSFQTNPLQVVWHAELMNFRLYMTFRCNVVIKTRMFHNLQNVHKCNEINLLINWNTGRREFIWVVEKFTLFISSYSVTLIYYMWYNSSVPTLRMHSAYFPHIGMYIRVFRHPVGTSNNSAEQRHVCNTKTVGEVLKPLS